MAEDELGRLALEMAHVLLRLEPESEARRRLLGQRIIKLLAPDTRLGAEANLLAMSRAERLRLCVDLLGAVWFARAQAEPATILPAFAEWLAEHREETKPKRGQREDRRVRDGFLGYLAHVLTGTGISVTAFAGNDGSPPAAWAEVARVLAPWAGVELPTDRRAEQRELRRLLTALLKRANVPQPRGRPRRRAPNR